MTPNVTELSEAKEFLFLCFTAIPLVVKVMMFGLCSSALALESSC